MIRVPVEARANRYYSNAPPLAIFVDCIYPSSTGSLDGWVQEHRAGLVSLARLQIKIPGRVNVDPGVIYNDFQCLSCL